MIDIKVKKFYLKSTITGQTELLGFWTFSIIWYSRKQKI
jgi:hypothetical protein